MTAKHRNRQRKCVRPPCLSSQPENNTVSGDASARTNDKSGEHSEGAPGSSPAPADIEIRFRRLVEIAPVGYLWLQNDGRIRQANPKAGELLDKAPHELIGRRITEFIEETDRDACERHLRSAAGHSSEKVSCKLRFPARRGAAAWVQLETICSYLDSSSGDPGIHAFLTDHTSQHRTQIQLDAEQQRLSLAIEAGNIGLWEYDLVNGGVYWSPMLFDLLGRDRAEPVDEETFVSYVHPDDREATWTHAERWMREGGDFREEFRVVREDGQVRWFASLGRTFPVSGKGLRAIGVNYDITKSRETVEALDQARDELEHRVSARTTDLREMVSRLQTETARRQLAEDAMQKRSRQLEATNAELQRRTKQLQRLALQVSTAENREREKLAEILHDDLQQILVGSRFHLDVVRKATDQQAVLNVIGEIDRLLSDAIEKSRSLSHELSPPALGKKGLGAALQMLCGQMKSQHGLTVHFESEEQASDLPAEFRTFLYKATREILFNVVKHAGVREADLKLSSDGNLLEVIVQDGGMGFDLEEGMPRSTAGGMGLYRISEQIEALGGSMELVSFPGDGCQLRLLLPIEERG